MKKIIISGVFGLSMATTMLLHANSEGDSYGGIQYGLGTYSEDGFDDANPNALVGRYGKFVNDNFAIEGRIGFGVGDDSVNDPTVGDIAIEIDSLLGVYGVGHVAINDSSSVYGLLGFSRGELTATATDFGISISDDDTGLSFGVGSNIGLSDTLALNIEYTQYLSESTYDFTAIGLGVVFSFE